MRGFSIYLAAGILVVLAMDLIAPPVGMGFDVFAWPAVKGDAIVQHVDRTNKSDRLIVPTAIGRQLMPKRQPPLLVGCDPAFSPLSGGQRTNIAARCVS
jgi:hypothetical protein